MTLATPSASTRTQQLFAAQRTAFLAAPYPTLAARKDQLRRLRSQIQRYQDLFVDSLSADFGHRSASDTRMLDLLGCILHIDHMLDGLKRWMKPSRRSPELLFRSNSLRVEYQPKGVVGIISAWNFPLYIALAPLATALAAGNRVMLKMSEFTPHTNQVLQRMLAEIFSEDQVALIGGELSDPNLFSALPFDHIVFTGSPGVGRIVMRTAAEHLVPVTLELGGKSPAIVLSDYDIDDAARRIVHGKCTNCGQICIAPDHVFVPRAALARFTAAATRHFKAMYGNDPANNPDYTSIINERNYQRITGLLDDARLLGGEIISCGAPAVGRKLPLQLVTGVTPAMRIMREELFGPILPILPYDSLDEVYAVIRQGERPLALYCFSHDQARVAELLRNTHSGGVTVNDWAWHAVNHDAPFGGIGNSGMGNYHSVEGFRELSHARTIFVRRRWFPTQLFHPPFGTWIQKMSMRLYLGSADPALGPTRGSNK